MVRRRKAKLGEKPKTPEMRKFFFKRLVEKLKPAERIAEKEKIKKIERKKLTKKIARIEAGWPKHLEKWAIEKLSTAPEGSVVQYPDRPMIWFIKERCEKEVFIRRLEPTEVPLARAGRLGKKIE